MAWRGVNISSHRNASDLGNLLGQFGCRKNPSMAGFRSLGKLYLDHLDLFLGGFFLEHIGIEFSILGPAAEITGSYLPD